MLGYTWLGQIENWHQRAFTSFGDGHGVWETGGGNVLPFYARNFRNVPQWAAASRRRELMPTLAVCSRRFDTPPTVTDGRTRRNSADRIQSHGLDLAAALNGSNTGLVWAAVEEGDPIERARPYGEARVRASVVQVTNLGITVKDSPQNTLVFVTRLDTGAPVAGAQVSIVKLGQPDLVDRHDRAPTVWPSRRRRALREPDATGTKFAFLVTAEKDGDVAYVGSDWNEGDPAVGIRPPLDLERSRSDAAGHGVHRSRRLRLGEEVHFKAILRSNTPAGIRLLPDGTPCSSRVRDSQDSVVDERDGEGQRVEHGRMDVDAAGRRRARQLFGAARFWRPIGRSRPPSSSAGRDARARGPTTTSTTRRRSSASFLVAAYRRPDFRVDVTLTGDSRIAGDPLKGAVTARYLFGAPMGQAPDALDVHARRRSIRRPSRSREKFPSTSAGLFVGYPDDERTRRETRDALGRRRTLTAAGSFALDARHRARRRASVLLHARGRRRGRVAAAHREPREPHRASGAVVHRHQAAAATSSIRRPD